jgi:hypothetical protein
MIYIYVAHFKRYVETCDIIRYNLSQKKQHPIFDAHNIHLST